MLVQTRRMNRMLALVVVPLGALVAAAALTGFPAGSRAADDTAAGSATYVCRTIETGETANARMLAATPAELTCRPISLALKMSNGSMKMIGTVSAKRTSGPDLSSALTPGQVNDAWVKYVDETFHVDHSP